MRLLNPNPGECVDRQTILELKVKYGGGRQEKPDTSDEVVELTPERGLTRTVMKDPSPINVQPFIDENEQIQQYLERNWFTDIGEKQGKQFDVHYEELGEINHQVWKLMDQATVLKDAPDRAQERANARAAEVLFAIIELNAKRAEIVSKINALFSVQVQEKIFS